MSAAFRTASRRASSTACSALALALAVAGCGGAESEPAPPALPRDVGAPLAAAAGEVRAALEDGDPERAQREADELLAAVDAAIASGQVPEDLAPEVGAGAERLAALVAEIQPPPPPPEDEDDEDDEDTRDDEDDDSSGPGNGNGKGEGKGKGKGKGKGNGNGNGGD